MHIKLQDSTLLHLGYAYSKQVASMQRSAIEGFVRFPHDFATPHRVYACSRSLSLSKRTIPLHIKKNLYR